MPPTRKSSRTTVKRKTLLNRRSLKVDVVAREGRRSIKLTEQAELDPPTSFNKALKHMTYRIGERLPDLPVEPHSTD